MKKLCCYLVHAIFSKGPNVKLLLTIIFFIPEFIDALTDPRAYVSAQEKRAEMLKAIGVDESDISTEVIVGKGGATNKKNAMSGIMGMAPGKKPEERGNKLFLWVKEIIYKPK